MHRRRLKLGIRPRTVAPLCGLLIFTALIVSVTLTSCCERLRSCLVRQAGSSGKGHIMDSCARGLLVESNQCCTREDPAVTSSRGRHASVFTGSDATICTETSARLCSYSAIIHHSWRSRNLEAFRKSGRRPGLKIILAGHIYFGQTKTIED